MQSDAQQLEYRNTHKVDGNQTTEMKPDKARRNTLSQKTKRLVVPRKIDEVDEDTILIFAN